MSPGPISTHLCCRCAISDSAENGFPWDAGADRDDAAGIESVDLRDVHEVLVGDVEVVRLAGGVDGLVHRRPRIDTTRSFARAAFTICWTRWMWLEKHAAPTSPGAPATMSCRTGPTVRSLTEYPGSSAFVESESSRCTPLPRPASSASPWRSVARPSSGVWSILKSPVCRIEPNGVSTTTAVPSGIECVTRRNRIVNGPAVACSPGVTVLDRPGASPRAPRACSAGARA